MDARRRLLALLDLLELDANYRQPRDIESITERFCVLRQRAHARVGLVDSDCPDFLARLFKRHNHVGAIHPAGRFFEQIPQLVPKRRNHIRTGLLSRRCFFLFHCALSRLANRFQARVAIGGRLTTRSPVKEQGIYPRSFAPRRDPRCWRALNFQSRRIVLASEGRADARGHPQEGTVSEF